MSAVLPINLDLLVPWVAAWLFSAVRISTFMITVPIFSQLEIPAHIKVVLMLSVAFIFAPAIVKAHSHTPDVFSGGGLVVVIQESIIGFAMGLIFKITFEVLNLMGQMIGTAMQLNFAEVYSPADGRQTNILGSFYQIFGMLIFIALHGPLILFTVIYQSFQVMPLGISVISNFQIHSLIEFSETMFLFSLLLALPVIITLFIVNVGMMVMARLSTTFNIFTVGFVVTIFVGLGVLVLSIPLSLHGFSDLLDRTYQFVLNWQTVR